VDGTSEQRSGIDWRELIAVVLLSVTAVLTAWSGFQAAKWGGAMAISFSQAGAARLEAARLEGVANRKQTIQVALFAQWAQATVTQNDSVVEFLAARFPEPLNSAFDAWQATNPSTNPTAPLSPFDMPEYLLPELASAQAVDARAEETFTRALENNRRGDNYTLLTVAFASVLFFAAMSGKVSSRRSQWVLLGVGLGLFTLAVLSLLVFPKLI
jgi:hypothetical protein